MAKEAGIRIKKLMTGVPKTKEHREKIGRKGLIMLKSNITGNCIRITKEDKHLYDATEWMNPFALSKIQKKHENQIN